MLYGDKYPDKWWRWHPSKRLDGWVGIKRNNGVWAWSNGAPIHRTKWYNERQPKKDEDCASFDWKLKKGIWGFEWHNVDCAEKTYYACEYKGEFKCDFCD